MMMPYLTGWKVEELSRAQKRVNDGDGAGEVEDADAVLECQISFTG